jgi:leucyl aminopeptidase
MLEVLFGQKIGKHEVVVIPMLENQAVKVDCLTEEEADCVQNGIVQAAFRGQFGKIVTIFSARRVIVVVGLGEAPKDTDKQSAGRLLYDTLKHYEQAYIDAPDDNTALQLAYGVLLGSYSFDKYKTAKKPDEFAQLERISVAVTDKEAAQEAFKSLVAVVTAVRYCKDLCNEPASYLSPDVFAADIDRLKYLGFEIEVLDEKEIEARGLKLIAAVAQGSARPPRFVVMRWQGNRNSEEYDLALVGKGVCFDAGGLSLKSTAGMNDMKMDMYGAAVAVAVLKAAALRRIRKNLIAVVGLVDNMPSGSAMKIGDVYGSYKGLTVEIGNTDAEGRLVAADCMAYVQKNYKVKKMVVVATLGALKNVLGNVYAGLFANNRALADSLMAAGEKCGEKLWPMPLDEAYGKMLASPIADLRNVSGEGKASIVSAAFLSRFVEKGVAWAHIDMSGMRLDSTGLASGFGVRLLSEFVKEL